MRAARGRASSGCEIGIALGPASARFLDRYPDLVQFVEIAYEQLLHDSDHAAVCQRRNVVLHCSALSLGGTTRQEAKTIQHIAQLAGALKSPWVGEHLAFSTAKHIPTAGDDASPHPTDYKIGFTVCPQLSRESLGRIVKRIDRAQRGLPVPLIVENPPIYFDLPGSSIDLPEFTSEICARTGCGLLLDIAHLLVTARNSQLDPFTLLHRFPLTRVVEVHMSGCTRQLGVWWDDHSMPADECAFAMLREVAKVHRPRAITFEYNWSASFPMATLAEHLELARRMLH